MRDFIDLDCVAGCLLRGIIGRAGSFLGPCAGSGRLLVGPPPDQLAAGASLLKPGPPAG